MTPADFGNRNDLGDDKPRNGAMELARYLHSQAARGHSGVLILVPGSGPAQAPAPASSQAGTGASPRRIGLRQGLVYGIDAGPSAPVSPESQLRYLLRQRARPEFQPGAQLSARYAVDEFRPDLSIRQHIEAQAVGPEALRARIGTQRISVVSPPHASALHPEEQAIVRLLSTEPHTVPQLLDKGAKGAWSPLRALRFLVVLDALGSLVIGEHPGAVAEAYVILELDQGATIAEVKAAYRRLARTLHPDSRPGLTEPERRELTDRFTVVHAAYRLLLQHKS